MVFKVAHSDFSADPHTAVDTIIGVSLWVALTKWELMKNNNFRAAFRTLVQNGMF